MSNIRERLTPTAVEDTLAWLKKNKCGCVYYTLGDVVPGQRWAIVFGWSDGFEDEGFDGDSNGTFRICGKIAYQSKNNIMQCDYDIDWTMPYDEAAGEVYDTDIEITGFSDVEWLLKEWEAVEANLLRDGRLER